jgi:hypothetical protein
MVLTEQQAQFLNKLNKAQIAALIFKTLARRLLHFVYDIERIGRWAIFALEKTRGQINFQKKLGNYTLSDVITIWITYQSILNTWKLFCFFIRIVFLVFSVLVGTKKFSE